MTATPAEVGFVECVEYHGVGGPLPVSDPAERHPLADAWLAAGDEGG